MGRTALTLLLQSDSANEIDLSADCYLHLYKTEKDMSGEG